MDLNWLLRHQPLAGHLVARFQLPSGRGGNSPCSYAPVKTAVVPVAADAIYAVHKKRALFSSNFSIHLLLRGHTGSIVLVMNSRSAPCHQTVRLHFLRHPP